MQFSWKVYHVLTTYDWNVDLDIRQEERRLAGIVINMKNIEEEERQANSGHNSYPD